MANCACSTAVTWGTLCPLWIHRTDISATPLASLSADTLATHNGYTCSTKADTAANSGSSSAGLFLLSFGISPGSRLVVH